MTLVTRRICLISGVLSAHKVARPSNPVFARLSQVAGVRSSGNSPFKIPSQCFAVPELSNIVIETIFALFRVGWGSNTYV